MMRCLLWQAGASGWSGLGWAGGECPVWPITMVRCSHQIVLYTTLLPNEEHDMGTIVDLSTKCPSHEQSGAFALHDGRTRTLQYSHGGRT